MKIDRNNLYRFPSGVKPCFTMRLMRCIAVISILQPLQSSLSAQSPAANSISAPPGANHASNQPALQESHSGKVIGQANDAARVAQARQSSPRALALVDQVLHRLAHGQAFDCEIRQRVRAAGGESLGVGTYLQVGGGTGQFSMQVAMHDGDGKHTMQQISDGRLAYTRTEIGGRISLVRVDVSSLDEGARVLRRNDPIKPSMLVGGPSEMLDTIRRDYDLRLGQSELDGQALLVIIGTLKPLKRQAIAKGGDLPELFPSQVHLMIAAEDHPKTGFGKGLPVRIEHRADYRADYRAAPVEPTRDAITSAPDSNAPQRRAVSQGRLISLIEFYSIRPVTPPPIQRFRFENQDASVTFVNETRRYEDRFDIRVSAKERARYR